MKKRFMLAATTAAIMSTGVAFAIPADASAPSSGSGYWQTRVVFADGSSVITRGDTGNVTVDPGRSAATNDSQAQQSQAGGVHPMTGTPQGFHLYGNRLSTAYYIYNSTMGPVYLDYCDASGCLQHGEVRVGFQEYAYGASSIRWKMTAKSLHISGPAYHYEVEYWCGVNVPNKTDWTCDTHSSDADGYEAYLVEYGTGNGSHVSNYSFGSGERQYAKFPMVQTVVSFPGYPVGPVNIKFRGWDTRYYSKSPKAGITNGWLLAPATGTGD